LPEFDEDPDRDTNIQYLFDQLADHATSIRLQASAVLLSAEMLCGPLGIDRRSFPSVYKLLEDTAPRLRENGIRILAFAGNPKPHLEVADTARVLPLLDDESKRVRQTAAVVSLYDRPLREETLQAVFDHFDKDPELRQSILRTIGEVPITGKQGVSLLTRALRGSSTRDRLDAMAAIFKLGSEADPGLLPVVQSLLRSPDEATRKVAANLLLTLGK
jgi:HEAT repeat protein